MGIVSFDLNNLPPIPEEEKAHYDAMAEAQRTGVLNQQIDCSDIPEITEEQFARMRPFREVVAELRAQRAQPSTAHGTPHDGYGPGTIRQAGNLESGNAVTHDQIVALPELLRAKSLPPV